MATREPIVDWDKVRRLQAAVTPDLYKGTAYQPDTPPKKDDRPPVTLQGVPPPPPAKPAKKAPEPAAAKPAPTAERGPQAPPTAVARKPASSQPAAVAAERGVMAWPVDDAPRETQGAAPETEKPKDMHAFYYREQVEAMERKAMELGRPEEAKRVRNEYNSLIEGQYRSMENDWKAKTLPQVQAIQKALLDHEGKQVPRELVVKARELTLQASSQQKQMVAYTWGLIRNEATKPLGIRLFNESEMLQPGDVIADVRVEGDTVIGLDANGQVVQLKGGEDMRMPADALEQLYADTFEAQRKNWINVAEGGMAFDTVTGQTVRNPKTPDSATPSEQLSATKAAGDVIATRFGAKRDPVSNMIDPDTIKDMSGYTQALAEVEALVRSGVPPLDAANRVAQKYQAAQAAGTPSAGAYSGPIPGVRPGVR